MTRRPVGSRNAAARDREGKMQPIAEVLAGLMARRGYARVQAAEALDEAWREACGPLAPCTRVGQISRGVLEVVVTHSSVLQELSFRQQELLERIRKCAPTTRITALRLRLGQIEPS